MNARTDESTLYIDDIIKFQRNRYPVLLLDRVIDLVPGKSATGVKCFTYNEWFFPGHFDDDPNVPGTIQIESMAQTLLITFQCIEEFQGMKANASAYKKVNFRRKVLPGDVLTMNAKLISFRRGVAIGNVQGFVDKEQACSAEFLIVLPDIIEKFSPKKTI